MSCTRGTFIDLHKFLSAFSDWYSAVANFENNRGKRQASYYENPENWW